MKINKIMQKKRVINGLNCLIHMDKNDIMIRDINKMYAHSIMSLKMHACENNVFIFIILI